MTGVALATEDELSEAVGLKLLAEHPVLVSSASPMLLRRGGFGYLRARMDSWKQIARRQLVFVLTDLDRVSCPMALLEDWLGAERQCPPNLLLRIAVREVESWLLADQEALTVLMGSKVRSPGSPDELPDPKQYLIGLAKKAPRAVKENLVPERGAKASQGLGYNRCLVEWVHAEWSPVRAASRSPSLFRARRAISSAASRVKSCEVKL